jgi:hypothetical protein
VVGSTPAAPEGRVAGRFLNQISSASCCSRSLCLYHNNAASGFMPSFHLSERRSETARLPEGEASDPHNKVNGQLAGWLRSISKLLHQRHKANREEKAAKKPVTARDIQPPSSLVNLLLVDRNNRAMAALIGRATKMS